MIISDKLVSVEPLGQVDLTMATTHERVWLGVGETAEILGEIRHERATGWYARRGPWAGWSPLGTTGMNRGLAIHWLAAKRTP